MKMSNTWQPTNTPLKDHCPDFEFFNKFKQKIQAIIISLSGLKFFMLG